MSQIMLKVNAGEAPSKAAKAYIKAHPAQVNQWLSGVKAGMEKL